jgi:hypothetical protein
LAKKRVYVAFDYDDVAVKNEFIRQSRLPDCPFDLVDCSIEKPVDRNWPEVAKQRIAGSDCVIVLCGEQTHQSGGASTEVQIAQSLSKRILCIAATRQGTATPPKHIEKGTPIYTWRWPTVGTIVDGNKPPPDAVVRIAT